MYWHRLQLIAFSTALVSSGLVQQGCKETRTFSSKDYDSFTGSQDIAISDEEAETIFNRLVARFEAGEDLSATTRALMQVLMTQLSDQRSWQGLSLSNENRQALQTKRQTYQEQLDEALDQYGFVEGCDGLLFTSLLHAGGIDVDYSQAESTTEPGRWYRSVEKDCFSSGRSASTISRDMLIGLAVALWEAEDLAATERLIEYTDDNRGILGEAEDQETLLSRAFMSPTLEAIYHELRFRLGGENSARRGYIPDFSLELTGFQAHLQALGILLRGTFYNGVFDKDYDVLKSLQERQPRNALFQYLYQGYSNSDGDLVADILLDESLFPTDRLPTSADRCEAYLWQRDQASEDWEPCPEKEEIHPAVDFFIVSNLLLGESRLNLRSSR
jgi:hypothetical protein